MSPESRNTFRAYRLDGEGGGSIVSWDAVAAWTPALGPLWIHLDTGDELAQEWLRERSGLEEVICDSLLAGETRPGGTAVGKGLLVILRGVNLNPGADPEDMVSLRLWVDANRMVSSNRRPLVAIGDLAEELERGEGPRSSADLLIAVAGHLLDRVHPVLEVLCETVGEQEERAIVGEVGTLPTELAGLRREVIALRRHLAPQKDAMVRLAQNTAAFFDDDHRGSLHLLADQVTRYVEELDELRDRATVTSDLLSGHQAEVMNRRMWTLSLVAAIFLPLGLITGLLGINVAGIPGTSNEVAFLIVCVLLVLLVAVELLVLRRMKWF